MSDCHVRPHSRDQRDPQTRNLRSRSSSRDMSWRKPVPKFIPSPPLSPNQTLSQQCIGSPTATTFEYMVDRTNPFSMSLTSLKHELPPLPTDWKENIDRVTRKSSTNSRGSRTPPITPVATSPTHGFAHGYYHHPTVSQLPIAEVYQDQSAFQEVDLGDRKSHDHHYLADKENIPPLYSNYGSRRLAISPAANGSTVSVARMPKTYRPPTPPLPSRKRPSAPPTPIAATMNKPMHVIYPDLAGLGAEAQSQRTKSPESDDTVDTHTLRTVHSSLTTWTNTRGVSLDASTLADDDDRTLTAHQPHSIRKSAVVSNTMLVAEPNNPGTGTWKALAHWFDGFLNSFKSCLSDY